MMNGRFFQIKGERTIIFEKGRFDVVGHHIEEGHSIRVPAGKTLILQELEADCRFHCSPDLVMSEANLDESPYPLEWQPLLDRLSLASSGAVAIFLGEMDTGKTFLCTYLANKLRDKGKRVGIIDCDLGQSDIGPPGCLGLAIPRYAQFFMAEAPVRALSFVGAHSPEGFLTSIIIGLQKLLRIARAESDIILVDTCGWTLSDGARLLKAAKISTLEPTHVVLLQRQTELEHLVAPFPGLNITRLPVAKRSSPTDQMVRKGLREQISGRYFQFCHEFELPFSQFRTSGAYFRTGREIDSLGDVPLVYGEAYAGYEGYLAVFNDHIGAEQIKKVVDSHPPCRVISERMMTGILVGLQSREGITLGLGIIASVDFQRRTLVVATPLETIEDCSVLAFGVLRYYPDGSEAGFIAAGSL